MIRFSIPDFRSPDGGLTRNQPEPDLYVQFGCGHSAPAGWRSFDSSPTLLLERLWLVGRLIRKNRSRFPARVEHGDIVKGLPLPPASCAGIYASHVLEHLALEEFRAAVRNTYQLLRPGGTFRFVVPDLRTLAESYVGSDDPAAAIAFLRKSSLGVEKRARGLRGVAVAAWGGSTHLWMWDFPALRAELQYAGFSEIRRCWFGDAADPRFRDVEDAGRFELAVGVECRRPPGDGTASR